MRHITIGPYQPAKDEQAVFALWSSLLGDTWPLSFHTFHNITLDSIAYQEGDHLIAEDGHTILGFLATQTKPKKHQAQPRGEIMLLLLHFLCFFCILSKWTGSSHSRKREIA